MLRFPILTAMAAGLLLTAAVSTSDTPDAGAAGSSRVLRAGTAVVSVTPPSFPVRVNGMFEERTADRAVDPLFARAVALDDGTTRLAICVVDSCMVPRSLIDQAKAEAEAATGLSAGRMLVSATHTHSAPSAMACLGSREDPEYVRFLPGRIAAAIIGAVNNLQPAQAGWTAVDDWHHTFNRRWIRRPDRLLRNPFGEPNVRANMHPGFGSEDVTGPSGPVDPQLTLFGIRAADGRPLALLANYSMHYFGSPMLSSDYFGRFSEHVSRMIGGDADCNVILSQGTSGDLWAMDYGAQAREGVSYDSFAQEVAEVAAAAWRRIDWRDDVPLAMAQRTLTLNWRQASPERLAEARETVASLNGRLPATQREIYSNEAVELAARPDAELVLQAVKAGGLGITAIPNEVYALTGLKLKARSPFPLTMNIELANGAEGYIPPPEQHALGGYTTWNARTAGLEVEAEPKITEALLSLLEEVAGSPRRSPVPGSGPYAAAVRESKPAAYWRLEEMDGRTAQDFSGNNRPGTMEDGIALWLPGADGRRGHVPPGPPARNAFSGTEINRAAHFAGGRIRADVPCGDHYSVELWLWNGMPADARAVTGYFFSRGPAGDMEAAGDHAGIGGTYAPPGSPDVQGRLIVFNGNRRNELLAGRTVLAKHAWHHVVLVRDGTRVRVHLDGSPEPEIDGELPATWSASESTMFLGGRNDGMFSFEGKLDEIAVYPRALTAAEIQAHYAASGLRPPVTAVRAPHAPETQPLTPLESMRKIHVRNGYGFELVASEPLVADPVAIDWGTDGSLWVVEMADYPLGMDGAGSPGGRVRRLEDTDGDGRYDRSTLFAESLNFPTGILTWRDGVIVSAAPEILYLRDTDGDGRADSREVLISGLLQGNQQLRANGLRWGLDNFVYCAAGGHHGEYGTNTTLRSHRAGIDVPVGSRDFRFRPDTGELEPEAGPSQFGRNRDDWGRWFGTQNSRPLWHTVFTDRDLRRNPHLPPANPFHQVVTPVNPPVYPVSAPEKRYHSFEQAGHFTSACSGMIYRDRLLFADGMHAFTCEPVHNLVQHNILEDNGVTFRARRDPAGDGTDFFASEDRWFRPVMVRTGPDGALWVVDIYRYMIEHPDWLPENGRAELLPHYRLGENLGRIYRVFPSGAALRTPPRLDRLDTAGLAAALDTPNGWQRDKAHMALLWKAASLTPDGRAHLVATLAGMAAGHREPLVRVHALGILDGLGGLAPEHLTSAVKDPHPRVREVALTFSQNRENRELCAAAATLTGNPDPKVRLQLALAAGTWHNHPGEARAILGDIAVRDHDDRFLRAAVLSSAPGHEAAIAKALAAAGGPALASFADELTALAIARDDRATLAILLTSCLQPAEDFDVSRMETWAVLTRSLAARGRAWRDLRQGDDELSAILRGADDLIRFAAGVAHDPSRPEAERIAAARVLTPEADHRDRLIALLTEWLAPQSPGPLQAAAIPLLAATRDAKVPEVLLRAWPGLLPATRTAAVETLLSREPWALAFAQFLADGNPVALDASQRSRIQSHPSQRVRELAGRASPGLPGRADVVRDYMAALDLPGDRARGKAVFRRLCQSCHQYDGEGVDVGPNLRSVAGHPPAKLLTSILDPNADVQPGFHAYQCRLADGESIYGLITTESGSGITFKLPDGSTRSVLRSSIARLTATGLSLMPDGLEAGLTHQDMADLIHFLRSIPESRGGQPAEAAADLSVGAAAVNLPCDDDMPLAGYLLSRFTREQEGELRAVAVVAGKPGSSERVAIVACDVLWVPASITEPAVAEIEQTTGIPAANILVNATHTHHAPGTAPAHRFGWSAKFSNGVRDAIVRAVQEAAARATPATLHFRKGSERTVGANSRLRLPGEAVTWLNPAGEAGLRVEPTGPFDPDLPVLDFRRPDGSTAALVFNHSTHTIGTWSGRDVRSPGFYGLAAQELERELGGVVSFLEGASGSTHNIRGVSVPEAVDRLKSAVSAARESAVPLPAGRIGAIRRRFPFRVRTFDDAAEAAAIDRYTAAHAPDAAALIRDLFADARRDLLPHAGTERTTWLQVIALGDVAIVGVPAEYFTVLGIDIKRRSPFPHTIVAGLANDWIGYLPDREAHALGGYQTWSGYHSYAEPGTGERMADEAVRMLHELRPATASAGGDGEKPAEN